jgi:hypothetical protein
MCGLDGVRRKRVYRALACAGPWMAVALFAWKAQFVPVGSWGCTSRRRTLSVSSNVIGMPQVQLLITAGQKVDLSR